MALINLTQLDELATEAELNKALVDSFCYNTPGRESHLDGGIVFVILKAHRQAQNLFNKLQRLHQICADFSKGKFEAYMDDHLMYADDLQTDPYDPFQDLSYCFDSGSVEDLPVRIEQYEELLGLSQNFAETKKMKREGLTRLFGDIPRHYSAVDLEGQPVMISESDLPADVRNQLDANRQIGEIEIEFCLDHYNTFYQRSTDLLKVYRNGDVQACAKEILLLFNTYPLTH